jgi:hypothetical protein
MGWRGIGKGWLGKEKEYGMEQWLGTERLGTERVVAKQVVAMPQRSGGKLVTVVTFSLF